MQTAKEVNSHPCIVPHVKEFLFHVLHCHALQILPIFTWSYASDDGKIGFEI